VEVVRASQTRRSSAHTDEGGGSEVGAGMKVGEGGTRGGVEEEEEEEEEEGDAGRGEAVVVEGVVMVRRWSRGTAQAEGMNIKMNATAATTQRPFRPPFVRVLFPLSGLERTKSKVRIRPSMKEKTEKKKEEKMKNDQAMIGKGSVWAKACSKADRGGLEGALVRTFWFFWNAIAAGNGGVEDVLSRGNWFSPAPITFTLSEYASEQARVGTTMVFFS